ncbi:hypothetical protein BGZ60DRAFT_428097 [Tricladium varicosporioides]|nr:hypothetical protein BGZ60DRAFT_428097 [Hymenoscyphus varicosporioides]
MSSPAKSKPIIPHIHLLCMQPSASDAFTAALKQYKVTSSTIEYTIYNTYLADLPSTLTFDLVVSPANSYAILDGGFDNAISRAFSPKDDYSALTRAAQKEIYDSHRGYLPPGQCKIVKIPEEFRGKLRYHEGNGWGCKYLALCPTMRMPTPCNWDKEIVYECIWSLLNSIEKHNWAATEDENSGLSVIESILMTPLGTGTGGISDEKWARQAVLAIKHYTDAVEKPEVYNARNWGDPAFAKSHAELLLTHDFRSQFA